MFDPAGERIGKLRDVLVVYRAQVAPRVVGLIVEIPGKRRVFCGVCGSPVLSQRDSLPGVVRIRAGLLDEPVATAPAFHMHVASRCSWWPLQDDLPQHPQGYVPPGAA